jgi:hypothetical protein
MKTRARIKTITIDGQVRVIKPYQPIFGTERDAALAASETPEHAVSNIRKVIAHERRVARHRRSSPEIHTRAERIVLYYQHGKQAYKQAYGI